MFSIVSRSHRPGLGIRRQEYEQVKDTTRHKRGPSGNLGKRESSPLVEEAGGGSESPCFVHI